MATKEIVDPQLKYADELEQVVTEILKGETNPVKIAKTLGITRNSAQMYVDNWKQIAQNDANVRDRAREALTEMDRNYSLLMKSLWNVHELATTDARGLSIRADALKKIADIEAKRQEALQKAGMYNDSETANKIVEMEEMAENIKRLLGQVVSKFPETRSFIMDGIRETFGTGQSVETDEIVVDVVDGNGVDVVTGEVIE